MKACLLNKAWRCNTSLITVILGMSFLYPNAYGQPLVHPMNQHNALTTMHMDGKEKVKDFLNILNTQLENQLTYENKNKVIALLADKRKQCINTDDITGCEAGVLFAGAYRFQLEAENDPDHESEYLSIAKNYYRETLLLQPDHQSALKNLVQLNIAQEDVDTAIVLLKQMTKNYPEERSKNLIRIGDLYLEQHNPQEACNYFRQAYDENQASGEVCDRIASMYVLHGLQCFKMDNSTNQKSSAISLFAVSCSEAGLPNYSERMLRQQILYTVEEGKKDKIEENILLWTDILLDNRWFDTQRIEELIKGISSRKKTDPITLGMATKILQELTQISQATQTQKFPNDGFWMKHSPEIQIVKDKKLSPYLLVVKTLQYKGAQALTVGDLKNAENYLKEAFDRAEYEETRITKVAKDLALLYGSHPELDPKGIKLEEMINRLFEGKMIAYLSRNKELIREFHIVLGSIFYDRKKWDGSGYANALYQLEHALSIKLGAIVDPELRMMLGDVYTHVKNGGAKAVDAYIGSVKDMLLVDRLDEAGDLLKKTIKIAKGNKDSLHIKELEVLSRLIDVRAESANPKNQILDDSMYVTRYLAKMTKDEGRFAKYFSKDYIDIQYFKCLSDLGIQIEPVDMKSQQILFVEALSRVALLDSLHSANDFKRLQQIKLSLDKSIDRPYLMRPLKINVMYNVPNTSEVKQDNDKVIKLYSLGKSIQIPNSLFQLGSSVKEYYKVNQTREIPRYQFDNLKVNLMNNQIKHQ
ncbi:MAG: hypothetical protein WBB31_03265 [Saprospiraceae bacterium]